MDGDTYTVSERTAQVGFGPADGAKADIYREANDFCAKQNKKVQTVSLQMTNSAAFPASQRLVAVPVYVTCCRYPNLSVSLIWLLR